MTQAEESGETSLARRLLRRLDRPITTLALITAWAIVCVSILHLSSYRGLAVIAAFLAVRGRPFWLKAQRPRRPLPPAESAGEQALVRAFDTGVPPADASLAALVLHEARTRLTSLRQTRRQERWINTLLMLVLLAATGTAYANGRWVIASVVVVCSAAGTVRVQMWAAQRRRVLRRLTEWALSHTTDSDLEPTASVMIRRPRCGMRDATWRYRIKIDGLPPVGPLSRGGEVAVPVTPGTHAVQVINGNYGSDVTFVDVTDEQPAVLELQPLPRNFTRRMLGFFWPRATVQLTTLPTVGPTVTA